MANFKFIPSLEYLSCVQICIGVINHPELKKINPIISLQYSPLFDDPNVKKLNLHSTFDQIQEISLTHLAILNSKISALKLPKPCYGKIRSIALKMICEVQRWKADHFKILNLSDLLKISPIWSSIGTIDDLKLAQNLLHKPFLDDESRFLLACKYCFFEEARSIFETSGLKEIFDQESSHYNLSPSLIHWIYCYRLEIGLLESSFFNYCNTQIRFCSKHDLRHFLKVKTHAKKTRILRGLVLNPHVFMDIVIFCLLHLDEVTLQEVLRKVPVKILLCFLTWPFQNFFLDLADRTWTIISPEEFCIVLQFILKKMKSFQWQDLQLFEILQQFWQRSPTTFKDYANKSIFSELINILLNCNDLATLNIYSLNETFRKYTHTKIIRITEDLASFIMR